MAQQETWIGGGDEDPALTSRHTAGGSWGSIAEIRARTLDAFDSVPGAIRLVDGIANTETSILLSTHKRQGRVFTRRR